jgi:predicted site-specific integrase-resolvase
MLSTLKEIASALGVDPRTARLWIATGAPVRVRTVRVRVGRRSITRRRYLADSGALAAWAACR